MARTTGKRVARVLGRMTSQHKSAKHVDFTFVATNASYESMCVQSVKRLAQASRARTCVASVLQSGSIATQSAGTSVIVISKLADLTEEVLKKLSGSSESRQVVFISEFPIEAVTSRLMKLKIRRSNRLHVSDKHDEASQSELIQRLVSGMAENDGCKTIVDAWIEGNELVLLSPAFERMRVPNSKLVRFLGDSDRQFSAFEIDEDGRFLYWPHSDTHLGWKQFEQLINPTVAIKDGKKSDQFKQRYGRAIKSLREEKGLKQAEIHGLTDRQLRRIEQGLQMVTSKALESLAKAHELDIADYMKEIGRRAAN